MWQEEGPDPVSSGLLRLLDPVSWRPRRTAVPMMPAWLSIPSVLPPTAAWRRAIGAYSTGDHEHQQHRVEDEGGGRAWRWL
jgi:hypothetical protein